jgi:hypothetical protein
MDVGLNSCQIAGEHVHLIDRQSLLSAVSLTHLEDVFLILIFVEPGYISRVEDVVDILQHLLVDDLCVAEEEHSGFRLTASH